MYKQTINGVMRLSDSAFIPINENNSDYAAYLRWIGDGNTPEPEEGYVPDTEAQQVAMWTKIRAKRDYLSEYGGTKVSVSGVDKWFHSDQKSKTQQIALVMAGTSLPPIQWKTMDGSFVTMTPALALAIFQSALQQDPVIFAVAEQHRLNMEASTEPLKYDYSGGWPPMFGE